MTHMTSDPPNRRRFLIASGALGAAGLAGCTSRDGGGGGDGGDPGTIDISGSSTVYPVTTAMVELFRDENPGVDISVSRDGTSGGFENAFVPGDSDINNASRPITEEERQQCVDNGFEPIELLVARDALTVVVNNANDWVDCIGIDELARIWRPDDPAETWADVRDDWPAEEFDLYGAATTSGTFDYFTEQVVGEAGEIRSDFEGTEEDDLIAQGVDGNEYAMGYLPFAYYTNNEDGTKALELDEGDGCVAPSLENAKSGDYGLARPLFIYVNSERLADKPALQEFVSFYIENATRDDLLAERIGYVPSGEDVAEENRRAVAEYTE